jgi:hypothetical protein
VVLKWSLRLFMSISDGCGHWWSFNSAFI